MVTYRSRGDVISTINRLHTYAYVLGQSPIKWLSGATAIKQKLGADTSMSEMNAKKKNHVC